MSGLLAQRLANQGLAPTVHISPESVVAALGAVQAQDYPGAAWALALRVPELTLADVDLALTDGQLIRTHVLRPTWHLVAPADLRWMLALTAPRVRALMRPYDRRLELDAKLYTRAHRAIARALEGGRALTRAELSVALKSARIIATGQRLAHIVMDAELAGLVCSGPKRGSQMTYALIDERVPPVPALTREASLAALARRYFTSHGPATLHDFAWWSGLTMGDAREAVSLGDVGERVLAAPPTSDRVTGAHFLLPNYDEFLIAYKHRDAVIDPARKRNLGIFTSAEHPHQLVLHGRVAGSWRREVGPRAATIIVRAWQTPTRTEARAIAAAATRFGRFLGVPCDVRH